MKPKKHRRKTPGTCHDKNLCKLCGVLLTQNHYCRIVPAQNSNNDGGDNYVKQLSCHESTSKLPQPTNSKPEHRETKSVGTQTETIRIYKVSMSTQTDNDNNVPNEILSNDELLNIVTEKIGRCRILLSYLLTTYFYSNSQQYFYK